MRLHGNTETPSPVLVQTLLLAAPLTLAAAAVVGDLVVNFGSHLVLKLQDFLKRHGGQFCGRTEKVEDVIGF